jgi:hypothetical protein
MTLRLAMLAVLALTSHVSGGCCYLPSPPPASSVPAPTVAPVVAPAAGAAVAPVLPDALAALGEGGEMVPDSPGAATRTYRFAALDFATVQARTTAFMAANGWTIVAGSETDSESVARALESIGQAEAARLARATPSYGASFHHPLSSQTVAINIDSITGPLQLSINWF